MEIFKLVGSVMVDTAEAENSIQKTSDKTEGLGKKFADGVGKAAKWAAGVAAGAVAVGSAMVKAAKDTAADLDVIDKASQRMGIAAESYQELAYAAGLSGVEMSVMEKAAKKLEGTDLNLEEALDQVLAFGTAEERSAAAAELFGESIAYQMTPLLNAGAEGMAAMKQEANDLGLVMSQDTVTAGASMNDMFSKVEQSLSTLKTSLVAEIMPYVAEILEWVISNIPMIKDTIKSVMDAVLPIVKPILDAVMSFLPPIMDAVKKLMDWLIPYIEPIITEIKRIFDAFTALFNGDLGGFLEGIGTAIMNIGATLFKIGGDIFNSLWEGIKGVWQSIKNWVDEKVGWLVDKLAFWRKGSGEIDGESHAGGLAYVPYDNYPANLHRGEMILTASDANDLITAMRSLASGSTSSAPQTIVVQSVLDGKVIGESVTNYQRLKARAYGV